MTKIMTPKEIAVDFNTDPRTLRKFLRSNAKANGTETPGKGSRWAIEARSMRSLRKQFDAWVAAKAPAEGTDEVITPDDD